MNDMTPPKFGRKIGIGSALRRKEDPAFITGQGRYTSDVKRDGLLHGYVMRSPTRRRRSRSSRLRLRRLHRAFIWF